MQLQHAPARESKRELQALLHSRARISDNVPRALQRRGIVPHVNNEQQAADACDALLERCHVPLRCLAGSLSDMLRVDENVEPKEGVGCICASLKKFKN
jgi:hypothetical protein